LVTISTKGLMGHENCDVTSGYIGDACLDELLRSMDGMRYRWAPRYCAAINVATRRNCGAE
jgi:hypothetical protein